MSFYLCWQDFSVPCNIPPRPKPPLQVPFGQIAAPTVSSDGENSCLSFVKKQLSCCWNCVNNQQGDMEEHVPKKSGFYPPVLNEQIKIAVRWTHCVLLLLLICEFSTVAHKKECKRLFEGQFFRIFLRPHTTTRKRPLNTSSNLANVCQE